jgi:hypothetical protein
LRINHAGIKNCTYKKQAGGKNWKLSKKRATLAKISSLLLSLHRVVHVILKKRTVNREIGTLRKKEGEEWDTKKGMLKALWGILVGGSLELSQTSLELTVSAATFPLTVFFRENLLENHFYHFMREIIQVGPFR